MEGFLYTIDINLSIDPGSILFLNLSISESNISFALWADCAFNEEDIFSKSLIIDCLSSTIISVEGERTISSILSILL